MGYKIAVTGRRPKGLPWGNDELDERAISLKNRLKYTICSIIERGYDTFYVGMAEGIDTYIAEILLEFKVILGYDISIIAVIPYENFEAKRTPRNRQRYSNIMAAVDHIICMGNVASKGALFKRNEYMVDNADALLAVYDNIENGGTYNTLSYARKHNKEIFIEEI